MKFFPKSLSVKNKKSFEQLKFNRCKCYLRRALFEHIISFDEKNYFSLDAFNENKVGNMKETQKMIDEITRFFELWRNGV